MAETTKAPIEKVKLTVSQVLNDLAQGLDRKAIKAKYGLNSSGLKQLFQHPKLKGTKVKAAPNFDLIDDTPDKPVKETVAKVSSNAELSDDTAGKAEAAAAKGVW